MILYVLRYWPTLTETFVHDEIAAVAALVPVEIAAFDPRGDPFPPAAPARVHPRPHRWGWLQALPGLVVEALRGGMVGLGGGAPLRVMWLAALARRSRRVHVHFAGEAAAWTRRACLRAGVPYGVTVHAVDLFKPRADLAAILRDAALVVTISEHNRAVLRARFGVEAELVRCGVSVGVPEGPALPDPAPPDPAPPDPALPDPAPPDPAPPDPAPAGLPVILAVGRWVPKKGLDTLAAAATQLGGRAIVRMVSDAPPLPGVDVVGLRPRGEIAGHLRSAAVFVLPCREAPDGDMDGIPVALLEAMAAGLPVVTTPVSGIPEIVDEAVGWLVPPDDPAALVRVLSAVLDDPAEARRRGAAGRERLVERGFSEGDTHRSMARLLGVRPR